MLPAGYPRKHYFQKSTEGLGAQGAAVDDVPALDWDRVPPDELEQYRLAREKALGR